MSLTVLLTTAIKLPFHDNSIRCNPDSWIESDFKAVTLLDTWQKETLRIWPYLEGGPKGDERTNSRYQLFSSADAISKSIGAFCVPNCIKHFENSNFEYFG